MRKDCKIFFVTAKLNFNTNFGITFCTTFPLKILRTGRVISRVLKLFHPLLPYLLFPVIVIHNEETRIRSDKRYTTTCIVYMYQLLPATKKNVLSNHHKNICSRIFIGFKDQKKDLSLKKLTNFSIC